MVSRLCSCLTFLHFVMSVVKLVEFVKCLLKDLAMSVGADDVIKCH